MIQRFLIGNKNRLWLGLLIIIVALVYMSTILPGVGYSGDVAKFQYIGKILGIPHAPGYPLYVLLNRLFISLPIKSIAFRANFMSLFFGLITLVFLYLILIELKTPFYLAFGTTLTLAFSLTFWTQSLVAEVYTLNSFFLAIIIFFEIKWLDTGNDRFFYKGLFIFGLSLAHHLTLILLAPSLLFLILYFKPRLFLSLKTWLIGFLSLLAGLIPYSYLFIRTHWQAPYVEAAVRNFYDLLKTITAKRFQSHLFAFSWQDLLIERLPWFGQQLAKEWIWPLLIICVLGLVHLFRYRRGLAFFLFIFLCFQILFILNYDIPDIFVFFIPVYFILAIYLATGWSWLKMRLAQPLWQGPGLTKRAWPTCFVSALCLSAALWLLISHFPQARMTKVDNYDGRLNALFDSLKPDRAAIVISANYHETQFFNYKIYIDYPQLLVLHFSLNPEENFLAQLTRKLNREIRNNNRLKGYLFANCGRDTLPEILVERFWSDTYKSKREELLGSIYFVSPSLRQWLADQEIKTKKIIYVEKKKNRLFSFYQVLISSQL